MDGWDVVRQAMVVVLGFWDRIKQAPIVPLGFSNGFKRTGFRSLASLFMAVVTIAGGF